MPAGRTVKALIQQMDMIPWLFALADIPVPHTFETQSLTQAFIDDAFIGRETVYCEQGTDLLLPIKFMSMVRTADWKLVHFLDEDFGQLFDLRNDPMEEINRWSDPTTGAVKREMLDRLYVWRMQSQLHTADWACEAR